MFGIWEISNWGIITSAYRALQPWSFHIEVSRSSLDILSTLKYKTSNGKTKWSSPMMIPIEKVCQSGIQTTFYARRTISVLFLMVPTIPYSFQLDKDAWTMTVLQWMIHLPIIRCKTVSVTPVKLADITFLCTPNGHIIFCLTQIRIYISVAARVSFEIHQLIMCSIPINKYLWPSSVIVKGPAKPIAHVAEIPGTGSIDVVLNFGKKPALWNPYQLFTYSKISLWPVGHQSGLR